MTIYFRLRSYFSHQIETTARKLENHDALVTEAIARGKANQTSALISRRRLFEDLETLKSEDKRLAATIAKWQERARNSKNETDGIECLQRKKQCEEKKRFIQQQVNKIASALKDIDNRVNKLTKEIQELSQKQKILRAQESIKKKFSSTTLHLHNSEVHEILERWEAQVSTFDSIEEHCLNSIDPLETQYVEEEEREALARELHELKN